jgi:hypothetical protein
MSASPTTLSKSILRRARTSSLVGSFSSATTLTKPVLVQIHIINSSAPYCLILGVFLSINAKSVVARRSILSLALINRVFDIQFLASLPVIDLQKWNAESGLSYIPRIVFTTLQFPGLWSVAGREASD